MVLAGLLSGCSSVDSGIDQAMVLREKLLKGSCSFDAVITADYGDRIYTFEMQNTADEQGNVKFEVQKPESIANITGEITQEKGKLTFDDKVLAFELMADEQITPVSAPWILIKTLRCGYIHACEATDEGLHIQIDDSYKEDALRLDIWLEEGSTPVRAEILQDGMRILTLQIGSFQIL